MGQELDCRFRLGRRTLAGRAWLETDHLLFRGEERIKIPFKNLTAVTAANGLLNLQYEGGDAALELGAAAEKWAHKILHPPSRASKLGIKPGLSFRLLGGFDAGFKAEIKELEPVPPKAKADLIFLHAPAKKHLEQLPKLARALNPKGALWVVYPKGVTGIREIEVIHAGRAAGLKDVKVVSFSPTQTALKFV